MSPKLTSIEDLNDRAWFRLLKVLYALAAIVVALFLLICASQVAMTEDQSSVEAARLFASGTQVSHPLPPNATPQEIWDSGTPVSPPKMQSANAQTGDTFNWNDGIPVSPSSLGGIPDMSYNNPAPLPTYHEDWVMFTLYAAIAILIEALLFGIIRRAFYYVLLGTPMWRRRKSDARRGAS